MRPDGIQRWYRLVALGDWDFLLAALRFGLFPSNPAMQNSDEGDSLLLTDVAAIQDEHKDNSHSDPAAVHSSESKEHKDDSHSASAAAHSSKSEEHKDDSHSAPAAAHSSKSEEHKSQGASSTVSQAEPFSLLLSPHSSAASPAHRHHP
jgi:hypothetical protein